MSPKLNGVWLALTPTLRVQYFVHFSDCESTLHVLSSCVAHQKARFRLFTDLNSLINIPSSPVPPTPIWLLNSTADTQLGLWTGVVTRQLLQFLDSVKVSAIGKTATAISKLVLELAIDTFRKRCALVLN